MENNESITKKEFWLYVCFFTLGVIADYYQLYRGFYITHKLYWSIHSDRGLFWLLTFAFSLSIFTLYTVWKKLVIKQ